MTRKLLYLLSAIFIILLISGELRFHRNSKEYSPNTLQFSEYQINQLPQNLNNILRNYHLIDINARNYRDHIEVEYANKDFFSTTLSTESNMLLGKNLIYIRQLHDKTQLNFITILPTASSSITYEELGLNMVYDTGFNGYVFQYGYDKTPLYIFKVENGILQGIKNFGKEEYNVEQNNQCDTLFLIKQRLDKNNEVFVFEKQLGNMHNSWCNGTVLDYDKLIRLKDPNLHPVVNLPNKNAVKCKVGCTQMVELQNDTAYYKSGILCQNKSISGFLKSRALIKCHTINPLFYSVTLSKETDIIGGFTNFYSYCNTWDLEEASPENNMVARLKLNVQFGFSYLDTVKCIGPINSKYIQAGYWTKGSQSMTIGRSKELEFSFR